MKTENKAPLLSHKKNMSFIMYRYVCDKIFCDKNCKIWFIRAFIVLEVITKWSEKFIRSDYNFNISYTLKINSQIIGVFARPFLYELLKQYISNLFQPEETLV